MKDFRLPFCYQSRCTCNSFCCLQI